MSIDRQISRRRERALTGSFGVKNRGTHPVFAPYDVLSPSGRTYRVVLRSFEQHVNSCTCPDFQTNLLGTCKHIEAVRHWVRKTQGLRLPAAMADAPPVTHVYLAYRDAIEVAITPSAGHRGHLRDLVNACFDPTGTLVGDPAVRLPYFRERLARLPGRIQERVCVSPEVAAYAALLADRQAIETRRRWFLAQVRAGRRSLDLLGTRLYPFQEQGALHLAFGRRAMLADAMGLGKTIEALAATVLLRELTGLAHVLVVCPASLKHQWFREIRRLTCLSARVVDGPAVRRQEHYRAGAFFTIINYELAVRDWAVLERLSPDLVILDEAQRIKNWRTRTADAVKRLKSRYAFVLTGTPLENNLDELYSVMQFLDPRLLGPLWQFNHRYYMLERRESGSYKVLGQKNLEELRSRLRPVVLRRTAAEVALELPSRIDNNYFVAMTREQLTAYDRHRSTVAMLAGTAERRALSPRELEILRNTLTTMRLLCDALELGELHVAPKVAARTSPKLDELAHIIEDHLDGTDRKAIVFSSFEGMIDLAVERVARPRGLGHVKLTGRVPAAKRGALVDRFRDDPTCRLFFATDAGGVGLNLQSASLVINLDMPWNPAVLDQRTARAHRIGQTRCVNVINLVAQGTIEERILDAQATKRALFAGVFSKDAPDEIVFDSRRGLLSRLREVFATAVANPQTGMTHDDARVTTDDAPRGAIASIESDSIAPMPPMDLPPAAASPATPAAAGTAALATTATPGAGQWVLDEPAEQPPPPSLDGAAWIVTGASEPMGGATTASDAAVSGHSGAGSGDVSVAGGDLVPVPAPRPRTVAAIAGRLAVALTGDLGGRILLVKLVPSIPPFAAASTTGERVLIVVDREAADLAGRIEMIAARTLGVHHDVALHVFDRAGYGALQALLGGVLDSDELSAEAYRAPGLPRAGEGSGPAPTAFDARIKEARYVYEQAGDRLRLGRVILGSGFARDALAPLAAALDGSIEVLMALTDGHSRHDKTPAMLDRVLVRSGHLSADVAASIPWARVLLAPGSSAPVIPDVALVERAVRIVERVHAAAHAALIGTTV